MAGRSPDIGTGSFHEKARREDFLKWFTIFLRSAVAGGARRSRIGQASIRTRGGGVNGPRWWKAKRGHGLTMDKARLKTADLWESRR
jgi:hypothetical protein